MAVIPINVLINWVVLNNAVMDVIQNSHLIEADGCSLVSTWIATKLTIAVASKSQIVVVSCAQILRECRCDSVIRLIRGFVHQLVSMVKLVMTIPVIVPDMTATVLYRLPGTVKDCTMPHSHIAVKSDGTDRRSLVWVLLSHSVSVLHGARISCRWVFTTVVMLRCDDGVPAVWRTPVG